MPLTASVGAPIRRRLAVLAVLTAMVALVFGDVLVSATRVVSQAGADGQEQFVAWRAFGFGQLRQGNLALWNPHLFCGAPYFGGFQSALLYPPNWLHLLLPVGPALNWLTALHLVLGGYAMWLWATHRGMSGAAGLVAAGLFMFCGPQFMHVSAGHFPNLSVMPWVPLLFLVIDETFERPRMRWWLMGVLVASMLVLAGQPQYVYYTAMAAGVYVALRLVRAQRRLAVAATLGSAALTAAGLTAVQGLTGLAASAETVRGAALPAGAAASFSLPPENLLTLVAPGFFGGAARAPYWGRCYLWEMSLFMGATGCFLAVYGAIRGDRRARRFAAAMALVLLILALGSHTPLWKALYRGLPGFDRFRGSSKFSFQAGTFLCLLAGAGLDRLLRQSRSSGGGGRRRLVVPAAATLTCGLLLTAAGLALRAEAAGPSAAWTRLFEAVDATEESYLPSAAYASSTFAREAGRLAGGSLLLAGATFLLLTVLLLAARRSPRLVYAVPGLALVEVIVFAWVFRSTFPAAEAGDPVVQALRAAQPGDYRILNVGKPNAALLHGAYDLWGYDPAVPRRYAEFMAFTQGQSVDEPSQYLPFRVLHRLYGMLRLRYVIPAVDPRPLEVQGLTALPRAFLVQTWRVAPDRDRLFAAAAGEFDPSREVLLETPPQFERRIASPPAAGPTGSVRVVSETTDTLTIEAQVETPSILVVTDGYSVHWRATGLAGSAQARYEIMPANHVLRGVPLAPGRHAIRMAYRPRAFVVGAWISGVTAAGLALLIFVRRRRQR
jgi:hypothetical protein